MAKELAEKPTRQSTRRKQSEHDNAKHLFVEQGMSAEDVSGIVGVNVKTVRRWAKVGNWRKQRDAFAAGRTNQLQDLYAQLNEINTHIKDRDEGQRYPDSKEADVIAKLTKSIHYMETELGLREVVNVCTELLPFIRLYEGEHADLFKGYMDKFISKKVADSK